MRQQLLILLVGILAIPAGAAAASAASVDDDSVAHVGNIFQGFETMVGVEVPMQVGIRVRTMLPADLFVLGGIGYSPATMGDAVGSFANALGMTGSSTSKVMGRAMHNAFVLDLRLGYKLRTSGKHYFDGMYIDFGYSLMVAQGGNVGITDISNTTGTQYAALAATNADVKSTLHDVAVHAGYTWSGLGRLILTGEVGLVKPVASVNRITTYQTDSVTANTIDNDLNKKLESTYRSLFIPTIGLWASFQFQ